MPARAIYRDPISKQRIGLTHKSSDSECPEKLTIQVTSQKIDAGGTLRYSAISRINKSVSWS